MYKIVCGLGLVFACGCQPSQNLSSWEEGSVANIFIDDPDHLFSEEELADIHTAAQEWSEATNDHVTFTFVTSKGSDSLIVIRPKLLATIEDETGMSAITRFDWWARGGGIDMPYDVSENDFHQMMLHEMGHSLGLDHDGPGTIMEHHLALQADHITCTDVYQFCDVNDCDASEFPPCLE